MGILDFFSPRNKNTAVAARDRLKILIQQERSRHGEPDYIPLLRRELLEVIRKYINVDADAVIVDFKREGEHDVLGISVELPEKAHADTNN